MRKLLFNIATRKVYGLLLCTVFVSSFIYAGDMHVVNETKVYGYPSINIKAIEKMPDQGYVLAGDVSGRAWVSKIDQHGKQVWEHIDPDLVERGQVGGYHDIVTLTDGSVFLCGATNIKSGNPKLPGLLSRVDARGILIYEKNILPNINDHFVHAKIQACQAWNRGIVLVGLVSIEPTRTSPARAHQWVAFLNAAGDVVWERLYDFPKDAAFEIPSFAISGDDSVVFTQPISKENSPHDFYTEVFKVNKKGVMVSHVVWPGEWSFVREVNKNNQNKLIGFLTLDDGYIYRLINDDLSIKKDVKTSIVGARDFRTLLASDGRSIYIFGDEHKLLGGYIKSIYKIDESGEVDHLKIPSKYINAFNAVSRNNSNGKYLTALSFNFNSKFADLNSKIGATLLWLKLK